VHLTPYTIKDWEKIDLEKGPVSTEERTRLVGPLTSTKDFTIDNRIDGSFLTRVPLDGTEYYQVDYNKVPREMSLETYLKQKILLLSDQKRTIYVFHAPPFGTNLDMINKTTHVGSRAVRQFINKHQPYLSLHGHIHETVDASGRFTDTIGNTVVASPGNEPFEKPNDYNRNYSQKGHALLITIDHFLDLHIERQNI